MSKWKTVRLGDVATYINGYAFKPSDWGQHGLPIIRIQNLTGNDYETNYYNGDISEKYHVKNGDVLISWSASLGIYEWKKNNALLNQHIFKVVFDKIDVDKYYFMFTVSSLLSSMEKHTHGSTMRHITKPVFDNIPFPFPPLETQKQIAAVLDKCTSLISKYKKMLEKYDTLIKSRFIEMFGDPIINTKSWNEDEFGNICILKAGKSIKANELSNKDKEHSYPCYGGNGIRGYIGKKSHSGNIVLIGRQGALCGNVQITNGDFYATEHAVVVTPKVEINSLWLYHLLYLMNLNRYKTGAAQPGLTVEKLNTVPVMIVPVKLQNDFASFVHQIDKSKFEYTNTGAAA